MRVLHLLAALVLGAAAAFVVACGSSSGKIPASDASRLDSALSRVAADTKAGDCEAAQQAVVHAQDVALSLPTSVDRKLRHRVEAGIANLKDRVPVECQQAQPSAPQQSTTTTPPPATTQAPDTTPTTDTSKPDTSTDEKPKTDTTPPNGNGNGNGNGNNGNGNGNNGNGNGTGTGTGTGTGDTSTGTGTTTTTPPAGDATGGTPGGSG